MSLEQSQVIDHIAHKLSSGCVVAVIIDSMDWSAENRHLELLRDKLNAYIRYFESGEVLERFPDARPGKLVISRYEFPASAEPFVKSAIETVRGTGMEFRMNVWPG